MKKFIYILFLAVFFTFQGVFTLADECNCQNRSLFSYKEYKNLTPENIKSLKLIRYTEAGVSKTNVDDIAQINQLYNYLSKIKITDESKMSCTDNTTIYSFTLKDNSKASIEIECEWIVIKGKNYNFTTDKK